MGQEVIRRASTVALRVSGRVWTASATPGGHAPAVVDFSIAMLRCRPMATPLSQLSDVIHARRTVKSFTGQALTRATIESLLELARWAPTHRLSEPWRFYALEQPAIAALGRYLSSEPQIAQVPDAAKGAAKLAKLLERLPGAGAIIQVTWVRSPDAAIDLEDHAAASAAIQNLLLAAAAAGLASYWATTAALIHPLTLRWCGADPAREGALGAIWLGYARENPAIPPRRPLAERLTYVQAGAPA
jgi:nitroreductase